jgi:fermentation-respiration switch protein FrsA (DUF1100 family)
MKWLWRSARILILAYLGVCLVLWLLENSLVYRPSSAHDWTAPPADIQADIQDVDLSSADGTQIHAWWLPCQGADEAVLYCHGNAGNLSYRGGSMAKMCDLLKVQVLIFDYPGYGKSGGRPTEQGCYHAADAAYAYLTDQKKIAPDKILLYGGSLGGGVAVDLASRKPHRGLILVKTFTSAPEAGASMLPWLPVRWLMRNRFDNLSKIKTCTRPVFIAHGTADTLIPFAQGKRLYEAANEPKQFFTLEGADHNDSLPAEFFTKLRGFLDKNP